MFLDLVLGLLASLDGVPAYAMACFLLLLAGIGAPWSQDVLLLAAAGLAWQGGLDPLAFAVSASVGILAGDAASLFFGHHYGARWIRRPWAARFVAPEHLPALEARMRRGGAPLSFVTRFLPGQRATLFFLFGTLRLPWRTFLLADGVATLFQVPLFVWGVRAPGWHWQALRVRFERADDALTLLLVAVLLAAWLLGRRRRRA